jgi:hypothetical protein
MALYRPFYPHTNRTLRVGTVATTIRWPRLSRDSIKYSLRHLETLLMALYEEGFRRTQIHLEIWHTEIFI